MNHYLFSVNFKYRSPPDLRITKFCSKKFIILEKDFSRALIKLKDIISAQYYKPEIFSYTVSNLSEPNDVLEPFIDKEKIKQQEKYNARRKFNPPKKSKKHCRGIDGW